MSSAHVQDMNGSWGVGKDETAAAKFCNAQSRMGVDVTSSVAHFTLANPCHAGGDWLQHARQQTSVCVQCCSQRLEGSL